MIAMADKVSIVIDAGHGGQDPGAVFQGREEKTDTLRLALAVGQILTENGMDVSYTRVTDRYHTPGEKAEMANYQDSDYFLSIHRNAMPVPGTASGIQTLIYDNGGAAQLMASEINKKLTEMGWKDLGVMERPGLIVLRKTKMRQCWWKPDFWIMSRITDFLIRISRRLPRLLQTEFWKR